MRHVVCLFVCLFSCTALSEAATRTVCSSGCQYTTLQTAINEAVPGDTILLRAGETYVGNFTLRAKAASSTAFITIKSDAPVTSLPPDGVRLVPEGKPGANTPRAALARLVGQGGSYRSTPIVRTEVGAHHYRLQFLEFDGVANAGYETLITIGSNTSTQTTTAAAPYEIVLDRLWLHGDARKGIKRGVAVDGRSIEILNSYIEDIFSTADSQAIASFNAPGPVRILNNFLEASGENIMLGGADPRIPNLIPSNFEIRGNHIYKDPRWLNAVLNTPGTPAASARTGGVLAAGTHYFKVVAAMSTGGDIILSAPSPEKAVTVAASGAAALSWPAVTGADKYRIYRGASPGGQSRYLESTTTSITYSGASELPGAPPTDGTRWTFKNLLELKNAQDVNIDGNLFENNWARFQAGYAIVFTPKNQEHTAPWSAVRNIVFRNNIVRHVSMGIAIAGWDYEAPSRNAENIEIVNNVFEDVSGKYGNKGAIFVLSSGPAGIVIDHNTFVHEAAVIEVEGPAISGFVYRNNFSRHNTYGIKGNTVGVGTSAMNMYFPGGILTANVLAGGPKAEYPAGNYFPPTADFLPSFVSPSTSDYTLVATSPFRNKGTDGRDIGVDMGELRLAQAAARVTSPAPPPPPPAPEPAPTPEPVPSTTLPEGWQSEDIGAVGKTGSASAGSGTFVVNGSGADVWGTADGFHFAYRRLSGDGTIVARVASLVGADVWTKAGVMIRATTDAGSAHAFMLVSSAKGLAFQRRKATGGVSTHTAGGAGTAPRWLKLSRAGNDITASTSFDGTSWTEVGRDTFSMPADVLIGLGTNAHNVLALATATFDNVSVTTGQALPTVWTSNDIGAVGKTGSASHDNGTVTVSGAGADVWGTADAFHFASRTLPGDGEIVARVASLTGTNTWSKAGVMMRQTLDAGAAHAFMLVSVGKGFAFQGRPVTGGSTVHTGGGAGTAPEWVRLTREGQVVTAAVSADGVTWSTVGTQTTSMVGEIRVGLAITNHDVRALATGTFDNLQVRER